MYYFLFSKELLLLFLFKNVFIDIRERKVWWGEREREMGCWGSTVSCVPATEDQACNPAMCPHQNQICDPLFHGKTLNQLSHTGQRSLHIFSPRAPPGFCDPLYSPVCLSNFESTHGPCDWIFCGIFKKSCWFSVCLFFLLFWGL